MKKIIVIGGGPGGYVAAIRAAQLGADVTIIEKQYLGGTCLNVGCIPTKCLLHSAELVEQIKTQGKDIGVEVEGVKVNFPQVIAHKNAISKQLTSGVAGLLKLNKVKKVDGTAKFTGEKQLEVTKPDGSKESMTADAIIVATGSVNAQPPIPGLKENPNCIDSTGALSLDKLPATMVVIGGGVIGLELACAYAAFGTKITVVEAMDHMLPMLDGDLTKIGVAHMKKMGMEFHLECPVQSVEDSPVGAKVVCKDKSGNTVSFEAEKVLVAIGRRANTAALDLAAGKIHNDKGRILVNDKMETSVPGVYAIGDCVFGHAQLAHTASAMGEVAAENICGHEAHYCEKTNPTCVYMEPEAASVGLTEEQCKAQGIAYKVGKFPMSANGKALILNGGEGLVKIIAGAEYGEILGMHIIGPRATDLIAEGALAIGGEMTLDELIDTIHEELLKSCELTGIWEKKLRDIEHKTYDPAEFINGLKEQINQIVIDVLSDNSSRRVTIMTEEDLKKKPEKKKTAAKKAETKKMPAKKKDEATAQNVDAQNADTQNAAAQPVSAPQTPADPMVGKPCPLCGKGVIIKGKTAYGCSNWKSGCQYRQPFSQM